MDDLKKMASLATVQDLQRNIRNYTYERKKKYLKEIKGNIAELNNQTIHEPVISEREKSLSLNTKMILHQTKLDMVNYKEALERSIYSDTLKLENTRKESIEIESDYRNRMVELRKALQTYPPAQYLVQLENKIRLNEFHIRKNKLEADNYRDIIRRYKEFRWHSEKSDIVKIARCMEEKRKRLAILDEMRRETDRLTRETEMQRLNVLKCRNEPALPLLQVFVVPENPRISPPKLTPLMDMLPSEDFKSMQADDTLEETTEPLAKMPRYSVPPRSAELSLKHDCLSFIATQKTLKTSNDAPNKHSLNAVGTDEKPKVTPDANVKNIHSNLLGELDANANKKSETSNKQIVVISEKILCEKEVEMIVKTTEMQKLQKVSVIGSAPHVGRSGLLQLHDNQPNKLHNLQVQEPAEALVAESLLLPPTLFRDASTIVMQAKPTGSTEVSEHSNNQKISNELYNPTKLGLRLDVSLGNLSMDIDSSHGDLSSLQQSADYSQMQRDLMNKYNVNSSPEFVYAKKNEETTVTSKFFKKAENREEMEVESAAAVDTTLAQEPATTAAVVEQQTLAVPMIVDKEAAQKLQLTSAGVKENLSTPADSELDDTYDFTSMLDTPSLLLSPKPDDPQTYEAATQQAPTTSLFGGPRPALNLTETLTASEQRTEPDASTLNASSAFSFNFQDKKKRGFFSLFN